jgi:hypothetical protein
MESSFLEPSMIRTYLVYTSCNISISRPPICGSAVSPRPARSSLTTTFSAAHVAEIRDVYSSIKVLQTGLLARSWIF